MHLPVVTAYVGLGANLGDAWANLRSAITALRGVPGVELVRVSSVYQTAPIDASGPDYLNAVAQVRSTLNPLALLDQLQSIESAHGRDRPYPNAPRTLDLDLLLYGEQVMHTNRLTIPHPRMHQRAFVLAPLAELVGDSFVIPIHGPLSQLLPDVADQPITRLESM